MSGSKALGWCTLPTASLNASRVGKHIAHSERTFQLSIVSGYMFDHISRLISFLPYLFSRPQSEKQKHDKAILSLLIGT